MSNSLLVTDVKVLATPQSDDDEVMFNVLRCQLTY